MTHDRITPADLRDGDRVVAKTPNGWRTCTHHKGFLAETIYGLTHEARHITLIYRTQEETA